MTASAKGTVEKPGKNVTAKAELNSGIVDTAAVPQCPVHQSAGGWVPGDLAGPSQTSLASDVPVLSGYPQKRLVRT